MKDAIFFFTGRGVDIFTTWLNVSRFGYGIELSPVGYWAMKNHGFEGFVVINLLISTLIFLAIRYTKKRWLMNLACTLFYSVSLWNFAIYLLATLSS
jgi:hypothetical protein